MLETFEKGYFDDHVLRLSVYEPHSNISGEETFLQDFLANASE